MNFFDVFEDITDNKTISPIAYVNTDTNMRRCLKSIHISPHEYTFIHYTYITTDDDRNHTCESLHDRKLFDSVPASLFRSLYTRTIIDETHEIVQYDATCITITNIYRVKHDSPLKFRNEQDFQRLIASINSYNYLRYSFEVPPFDTIQHDNEGYIIFQHR